MDAIEAIHTRRSIRSFRPVPLERALIEDLLWAAVQAPSPPASGETPWTLSVIEGVDWIAVLGDRAMQFARDTPRPGGPPRWTQKPGFKVFWDAPVLVLICAEAGNAEAPFDCCRVGQNLMIAAHASGVGSCWVGAPLPWLHSPGVPRELGIPEGFDPVVAIVLGYAAETPTGKPRPRPEVNWLYG